MQIFFVFSFLYKFMPSLLHHKTKLLNSILLLLGQNTVKPPETQCSIFRPSFHFGSVFKYKKIHWMQQTKNSLTLQDTSSAKYRKLYEA